MKPADDVWKNIRDELDPAAQRERDADKIRTAFVNGDFDTTDKLIAAHRPANDATPAFRYLTVEELTAPPKPRNELVGELDWSPGRVSMLAAEGFSGKSLAALSACISIASDRAIWGWFRPARSGDVAFWDYEIGEELTRARAKRLAIGMGLDFAAEVAPRLRLAAMPRLYLTSADGEEQWCRALDGCAFAVVDSLRRASPGVDENDSRITEYLDRLTRVSLTTGCAVLVIHHASTKGQEGGRRKAAPRGSSAIFDACGSVLIMSAEKGEPALVSHEKAPTTGTTTDDFYLEIGDVAADGDPKAGLRVTFRTVEAVSGPKKIGGAFSALQQRVLAVVREHGPCPSKNRICALAGGSKNTTLEAIGALIESGDIVETGGAYRVA